MIITSCSVNKVLVGLALRDKSSPIMIITSCSVNKVLVGLALRDKSSP